jgi:hypothetical protein
MAKVNEFKNMILDFLNANKLRPDIYNSWKGCEITQENIESFIMMIYSFSNFDGYKNIKLIILLFFMHLLHEEKNNIEFFTHIISNGGLDHVALLCKEHILTREHTINKQKLEEYVNNLDNKIYVSWLEEEIGKFNNLHSS